MADVDSTHEFTPAFIEIDAGTITGAPYSEGENGRRYHDEQIGTFQFFVAAVEADGGRLTLWIGPHYEAAMRHAEGARVDFEIDEPVHDLVAKSVVIRRIEPEPVACPAGVSADIWQMAQELWLDEGAEDGAVLIAKAVQAERDRWAKGAQG